MCLACKNFQLLGWFFKFISLSIPTIKILRWCIGFRHLRKIIKLIALFGSGFLTLAEPLNITTIGSNVVEFLSL